MKKILFLSYNYPYGGFGASTQCSLRVMSELALNNDYEIHCISQIGNKPNYPIDSRIIIHQIKIKRKQPKNSKWTKLSKVLTFPIYPLNSVVSVLRHLYAVTKICRRQDFDLVVSQCFPHESVLVGAYLKKKHIVKKHVAIIWDNMYGKSINIKIFHPFANSRQKKLESIIVKYSDKIVSLYPLKPFHDVNGDIPEAIGKRVYLGIPSVVPPTLPVHTIYSSVVKEGRINLLYSGTIIHPQYIQDMINLFNRTVMVEKINLIFFSKGLSNVEIESLRQSFKGSIQYNGYIPNKELLSIYDIVDGFLSFPGELSSIRSKCFEYMSYGHPMILFYNDERDVNLCTFAKYPRLLPIDISKECDSVIFIEKFLSDTIHERVPFEEVEKLFELDSPNAYVNLISALV